MVDAIKSAENSYADEIAVETTQHKERRLK